MNSKRLTSILFLSALTWHGAEAGLFINFDPDMNNGSFIAGDGNVKMYHDWTRVDAINLSFNSPQKSGPVCKLSINKKKYLDQVTLLLVKRANQSLPISFIAEFVDQKFGRETGLLHPYSRIEAYQWRIKTIESKNLNGQPAAEVIKLEPTEESTLKMSTWDFDGLNFQISGHESVQCYRDTKEK